MLHLLKQFIAVAETHSYSRASEKLHVSQPGITKNIKKLEAEFGGLLFIRTKRGCSLTELGTILYKHAKNIEQEIDSMYCGMESARYSLPRHFTLAYGMLWQILFAAKIFLAIEKEADRKFIITGKTGSTEAMTAELLNGECDLFLGRIPDQLDAKLVGEPVLRTHHSIFAYKNHRLLRERDPSHGISVQELSSFPWLILGSKGDLSGYEISESLKHNIEIKTIHDVDSFYIILQILQKSDYLIILPHQVGQSLKAYGIQELENQDLNFKEYNSGFLYRKQTKDDAGLKQIIGIINDLIGETLAEPRRATIAV